jgi:putative ABC transport system ATP-binding protein
MSLALLEARQLQRSFDDGRVPALRGVNLTLVEGEFVALVGPSGCGKTTLLQLFGTLDEPTAGDVLFRGQSLRELPDKAKFRAETVGFIFQSFHLLPTLSLLANVQVPMLEMPWSRAERMARAMELLTAVGLADRREARPNQLSGGERQRVAIARSLANRPAVLLADEPTGNLDSVNAGRIMELLRAIHRDRQMTVLLVTHNQEMAGYADRTVHMLDGQIAGRS